MDVGEHPHQVIELGDLTSLTARPVLFVMSFNNLTYTVASHRKTTIPTCFRQNNELLTADTVEGQTSMRSKTKVLLNDISGVAKEGEILAVLGASGSGKSTLIDALANRISRENLKGTVTLNGEALDSRLLKMLSAYLEETLMFSAEFRLPRSLSKAKKKARDQAVIEELGLENAAKTMIGDEHRRGVSGGERRRVSIPIDIIHDPVILFLDEPTSGLDSTSAFMVVKILQRIAQSGSIVIMSVHQPSHRILCLLDRLLFLSHGHLVYSGTPASLPIFFSELGYPISENENLMEFALDFINEIEGSPEGTKRLVELGKSWQQNKHPKDLDSGNSNMCLKSAITASISRGKLASSSSTTTFANPFWIEILVLTKRSIKNSSRMPELFWARLGPCLFVGSLLASIFWPLDSSPKGAHERSGFFVYLTVSAFLHCVDALPIILQERCILTRETAYSAYRHSSYVLSYTIADIPSLMIMSAAFTVTTFWAVGLAGGFPGFVFFFLTNLTSFWAGSSLVAFISAAVPHIMLGYIIIVVLLGNFFLFSGFLYPFQGAMQNEFDDASKCFVRGVQMFDNTPLVEIPGDMKMKFLKMLSDASGTRINSTTCITTGADILRENGFTDLNKWQCLWITVAWGFFFRVLFYF
ncbi:hypothetical protein MKW98_019992 [Papaver atlanticum]|uniref:ABC transporter domain-containing protein n=1 Tax=Papaver atlanticum TaxID=357466 RepID=A0AAD4S159_9MAGN|nr:hypothetical protein MKW98_019992 [Papaver atlanticum]